MEHDGELNLRDEEFNKLKLIMETAAKEVITEFLGTHNLTFNNNFLVTSSNGCDEYKIPNEYKRKFLELFNFGHLYYLDKYLHEDIIDMFLMVDFPLNGEDKINVYLICGIDSRNLQEFITNNNDLDTVLITEDDDILEIGYDNRIAIPIFESLQKEFMHRYNFKYTLYYNILKRYGDSV